MPARHHIIANDARTDQPLWDADLEPFLPPTYVKQAKHLKALMRQRCLPSASALLRALLCYVFCVRSLRQLGAWATLVGVATISDRAWSKRITNAQAWICWMLGEMLLATADFAVPRFPSARIRLIDASLVRSRACQGDLFYLHTSYLLLERRIDHLVLSDQHNSEGLHHFALLPGDILVADRGYCRRKSLAQVRAAQVDLIVRWHSTNLPLTLADGTSFDVAGWLQTITCDQAEHDVYENGQRLRLVVTRLSPEAAARERARRKRKAQKNGAQIQALTLLLAEWLVLITTLNVAQWPTAIVLQVYRTRWQVEILFKRLKQLARWHRLPSFAKQANLAVLAILLLGWKLIEALIQPMEAVSFQDLSLWQRTALAIETLRILLWGQWTWQTVLQKHRDLRRYLRKGCSMFQPTPQQVVMAHLQALSQIA